MYTYICGVGRRGASHYGQRVCVLCDKFCVRQIAHRLPINMNISLKSARDLCAQRTTSTHILYIYIYYILVAQIFAKRFSRTRCAIPRKWCSRRVSLWILIWVLTKYIYRCMYYTCLYRVRRGHSV